MQPIVQFQMKYKNYPPWFTFAKIRRSWSFHVVVCGGRLLRNVQRFIMHVHSDVLLKVNLSSEGCKRSRIHVYTRFSFNWKFLYIPFLLLIRELSAQFSRSIPIPEKKNSRK